MTRGRLRATSPALAIIAALALAVIAGVGVFAYTAQASDRATASAGATRSVLVAAQPLGVGTSFGDALDTGAIESRTFPVGTVPAGALTDASDIDRSSIALTSIAADRLLMRGDFGSELPVAGPLAVPAGLLAMSLELADPARVGTFLRPGSQIAVYGTVDVPGTSTAGTTSALPTKETNLVVDRVTVIGVGDATQAQAEGADQQAKETALVTVAVDQEQGARLVQAVQTGALYLALLGDGVDPAPQPGVTGADVFLGPSASPSAS